MHEKEYSKLEIFSENKEQANHTQKVCHSYSLNAYTKHINFSNINIKSNAWRWCLCELKIIFIGGPQIGRRLSEILLSWKALCINLLLRHVGHCNSYNLLFLIAYITYNTLFAYAMLIIKAKRLIKYVTLVGIPISF